MEDLTLSNLDELAPSISTPVPEWTQFLSLANSRLGYFHTILQAMDIHNQRMRKQYISRRKVEYMKRSSSRNRKRNEPVQRGMLWKQYRRLEGAVSNKILKLAGHRSVPESDQSKAHWEIACKRRLYLCQIHQWSWMQRSISMWIEKKNSALNNFVTCEMYCNDIDGESADLRESC